MPYATGTASDHDNMLDDLITFLTTTITPVNQRWTVLKDWLNPDTSFYSEPGFPQTGDMREVYLRGPGLGATAVDITSVEDNGSGIAKFIFTPGPTLAVNQEVILSGFTSNPSYNGVYVVDTTSAGYFEIDSISFGTTETGSFLIDAEAIHVNIRRFSIAVAGGVAANWEVSAATAFQTGSIFRGQPGCFNLSIPGSELYCTLSDDIFVYHLVGTGRYFNFLSIISTKNIYMQAGFYLPYATPSEFPFPIYITGNTPTFSDRWSTDSDDHLNFWNSTADEPASYLRHRDGQWLGSEIGNGPPSNTKVHIWPYNDNSSLGNSYNIIGNQDTPTSYTLLPLTLLSNFDGGNAYGELENIYFISSFNQAAGNTVVIDLVDHIVMQNVGKTSSNSDFAALRLE
jgi:hypothetical protein